MRGLWICAIVAAFGVSSAGFDAACQAAAKPAPTKTVVRQEAKTEKEADVKTGAKKPAAKVQLPAAIAAAFKKAYPEALIRSWAKETEKGGSLTALQSQEYIGAEASLS